VEADGAVADVAAAGEADLGLAALGEERAHDADAGAHLADEFVFGVAVHLVFDFEMEAALFVAPNVDAELFEEEGQVLDVFELRHPRRMVSPSVRIGRP
jgi:hypothetical protein